LERGGRRRRHRALIRQRANIQRLPPAANPATLSPTPLPSRERGSNGGPGFRPLRGNAGCARCAFAWAAPALGPLRCNPGYSKPGYLKMGHSLPVCGALKPLPPGGGEVWREGAVPQAPCFASSSPTRQHQRLPPAANPATLSPTPLPSRERGSNGGPGFRPLRGNAGCARCAFAWAAPALGPLRCNPGYSKPGYLKMGHSLPVCGALKPLPPGGGEVWREGAAPQAPCFDRQRANIQRLPPAANPATLSPTPLPSRERGFNGRSLPSLAMPAL